MQRSIYGFLAYIVFKEK